MTCSLYITAFKGIGRVAVRELRDQFGDALKKIRTHRVRDYDIAHFDWNGDIADLKQLGTVEDVFYFLTEVPLTGAREDLQNIQETISAIPLDPALAAHRQFNGPTRGRTSYRVVVQADHQPWQSYRRAHLHAPVEQAIQDRYGRWRRVPDNADLEFWVQQIDKQALIGLRLSDRTMRHRTYKTATLPAALRPTIARALSLLTRPEPGDIFLDPMCGTGTILIERALSGRYASLLGGDIDEAAVQATLENFGTRHKPRDIRQWDARTLPLPDQSVNKIATNPPWGRQLSLPDEARSLYTPLLIEIDRVLQPNGTVAILTSEWTALKQAIEPTGLTLTDQIKDIAVLGRRADIFVLQKI